ncbi:MAG: YfhO family protein [Acutalibacteraceae bacterium]|nr:YfhO family protein [Acutalibacteraceae bacterium]
MEKKLKKAIPIISPYAVLFVITMGILFTVYYIKGIAPFGDKSIAYADIGQMYVPTFYHIWDVLHGLKNPFLDWYSGTGINMMSVDVFSPFNIFFWFVPRDSILQSMSVFLALKVFVSAVTCHIFIDKLFNKINAGYKIAFSSLFAMSGYVLQYYTNIKWLEIIAVIPILMLGFYYLMKKQKLILYTICIALIMVISFYISVQVLIFLLLTSGLYISLMVEKEKRKTCSFNLALGTIMGMGLSMFKSLPIMFIILGSSRGEGNANLGYTKIASVAFKKINELTGNDINKWFMLLGLELAVVLGIIFIARFIKHKRATLFYLGEILIVCLPIIFEGTNRLLHLGSYVGFPMRSGFLISFVFITGACYCLNFEQEQRSIRKLTQKEKSKVVCKLSKIYNSFYTSLFLGVIGVTAVVLSVPIMLECSKLIRRYGCFFLNTQQLTIPKNYIKVIILTVIGLLFIISIKNTKIKSFFVVIAVIIPLSINTYSFIGADKYVYEEQNSQFLADSEMLNDVLPKEENPLNRIKTADNSLNTNYPLVLQRGSISSWNGYATDESIKALKSMGYSNAFTRMLDTGGTLLTNAVMGVKNTLTKNVLPQEVYTLEATYNGYNYYKNKYTLPTCIVSDSDITKIDTITTEISRVNNMIYHSVSDDSENIMENITDKSKLGCFYNLNKDNGNLSYTVKITGKKMMYFRSTRKNLSISVNGNTVPVSSYLKTDNTTYPARFNNNVIPLGFFNDTVINVTVSSNDSFSESEVYLYVLDVDKLEALCGEYTDVEDTAKAEKNKLTATVTATETDKVLFVPVSYDKGWSAKVNGNATEIQPAINKGFMAVPLKSGINEVELKFFPDYMPLGIAISTVFIIAFAGYIILYKRNPEAKPPKALEVLAHTVLFLVWWGVIIGVYILPMIVPIYHMVGSTPK